MYLSIVDLIVKLLNTAMVASQLCLGHALPSTVLLYVDHDRAMNILYPILL